ncbi:MAG: Alpha/beta hydrolase [Shouchella clausii]|jgi:acetyl esterase/lipase
MLTKKIQLFDDNSYANLYTYVLDPDISHNVYKKRPAIVVCPGGGYMLSAIKEGEAVATRFLAKGYHTFVLRYSTYFKERMVNNEVPPLNEKSYYPGPLVELMESIRIIKENAEEWYVDPDNIFVLGFSAGGHMAASLGVRWDEDSLLKKFQEGINPSLFKPKGILLCYPAVEVENSKENLLKHENLGTKRQGEFFYPAIFGNANPTKRQIEYLNIKNYIREDMPPVFLWHTYDDEITSSKDSTEFIYELIENNVHCEFHLFAHGKHGLALSDETYANSENDINKEVSEWVHLADNWMKLQINSRER